MMGIKQMLDAVVNKTRSTHRGRQLTGVYTTVENLATILQYEHLVHGFSFHVIRLVSPPWEHQTKEGLIESDLNSSGKNCSFHFCESLQTVHFNETIQWFTVKYMHCKNIKQHFCKHSTKHISLYEWRCLCVYLVKKKLYALIICF